MMDSISLLLFIVTFVSLFNIEENHKRLLSTRYKITVTSAHMIIATKLKEVFQSSTEAAAVFLC